MSKTTIIHGGAVLTPEGLKPGHGITMIDDRIDKVAPNGQLTASVGDVVIDATNQIILPGFINGHMHMYGVLSHGISTDALVTEFTSFLEDFWWPYVENRIDHKLAELTAKWACVEMIESGITTFFDILEAPNAIPGALRAEARAVEEAGLRAFLTFEACTRMGAENGEAGLAENLNFIESHKDDDLVRGAMSIHTLFTCPKPFVQKARQMARDVGAKFHMHLSESVMEPGWSMEHYGKRPGMVYDELGALDGDVIASQLVQVDGDEIAILKKTGATGVSMPLSNCEVGGGIAPVTEMLQAGMDVGLGTDGYINNFFEVMRGAFLIHKAHRQDPQAMPAQVVYDMATGMGARALGLGDLGVIREGARADVITVRLDDTPTPINEKNVYDQLILFRNPADVQNVFVNGRQLKKNGELTTLDKAAIRQELRAECARFWQSDTV